MTKKIIRHGDTPDTEYVQRLLEEYHNAKQFSDAATKRTDELKSELGKIVEQYGQADDKGHLWVGVGSHALKRERRVSKNLNVDAAETWAKGNGLWEEVSEVVERLSEDRLLSLAWEKPDYAEEIGDLYTDRIIWAFKVVEEKVEVGE
jgi:hypothetical protein